jgi:hypothetical protein
MSVQRLRKHCLETVSYNVTRFDPDYIATVCDGVAANFLLLLSNFMVVAEKF